MATASGAKATPPHSTIVKVLVERQNGVLGELTCLDISPYVTTEVWAHERQRVVVLNDSHFRAIPADHLLGNITGQAHFKWATRELDQRKFPRSTPGTNGG